MAELLSLSLSFSKSRNSKVFTYSDFDMAISFAIIGSILVTTLKIINNGRT